MIIAFLEAEISATRIYGETFLLKTKSEHRMNNDHARAQGRWRRGFLPSLLPGAPRDGRRMTCNDLPPQQQQQQQPLRQQAR